MKKINISLVGAGYWGSKLVKELKVIPGVNKVEIIDKKFESRMQSEVVINLTDGRSFKKFWEKYV